MEVPVERNLRGNQKRVNLHGNIECPRQIHVHSHGQEITVGVIHHDRDVFPRHHETSELTQAPLVSLADEGRNVVILPVIRIEILVSRNDHDLAREGLGERGLAGAGDPPKNENLHAPYTF